MTYRSEGAAEVDLIVEAGDELIAIEVKAACTLRAFRGTAWGTRLA